MAERRGRSAATESSSQGTRRFETESATEGDVRVAEGLASPLLEPAGGRSLRRGAWWQAARAAWLPARRAYAATTDAAFIHSDINGRRSRRMVLAAFFAADLMGAGLWAFWCEELLGLGAGGDAARDEHALACGPFGFNRLLLVFVCAACEGSMLLTAGRSPCSFWSDALLMPVWLGRLVVLDVVIWRLSPPMLLGDALWFSVMAVMCRVHSMALFVLAASQVFSLYLTMYLRGELGPDAAREFDVERYGVYSVGMVAMLTCAYILDEQRRLHSFEQFMCLQDQNAVLAERLLHWRVLASAADADGAGGDGGGASRRRTVSG